MTSRAGKLWLFTLVVVAATNRLDASAALGQTATAIDPSDVKKAEVANKPDAPPAPPASRPRPFRIEVVDRETGRGVPLVELRTVNEIRYVTDSNGIVAFDEPGLFNRRVFFSVSSHGYEFDKDGFGYRGKSVDVTEGGSARFEISRRNIAQRLYRITGEGIYRDSTLTGDAIPIREPILNAQVFGQDSVVNAVFGGKIHWFWGDTNRPDYPLGNFHVPGATSDLPGKGGLDPERGVNLAYLVDEKGFARPTAAMPGEGPTWISGLVVITNRAGLERMFAVYAKIRKQLEVYERGLVEWNPTAQKFEKVLAFPSAGSYAGEFPDGHPFLHTEAGVDYIYYASPYPLVRVRALAEDLKELENFEVYTCLKPGSRVARPAFDRDESGVLRYTWQRNAQVLRQEPQNKMITAHQIKPEEGLLNLRDTETGRTVIAHGGSVYWNHYRKRWVQIAAESYGASSLLGEIWFAEADTPIGPWVYARKVVTHQKYSFYNPKQQPMLDKDGGRTIFFEGTYTTTFSGNTDPTPRYDYNQVMYKLNLEDPRLALPVAIYRVPMAPDNRPYLLPGSSLAERGTSPSRRVAFFAPEHEGVASLPVFASTDLDRGQILSVGAASAGTVTGAVASSAGKPLFYILPADSKDRSGTTVPLYEIEVDPKGLKTYSVSLPDDNANAKANVRILGRVWRNPARLRLW
jgi:hypothetical protein